MSEVNQQSYPSEETKRGGQSVGGMGLIIALCLSAHYLKTNYPEQVQSIKTIMNDAVVAVTDKIREGNKDMVCETLALARAPTLGCTNK
jgi:hypothetical protein